MNQVYILWSYDDDDTPMLEGVFSSYDAAKSYIFNAIKTTKSEYSKDTWFVKGVNYKIEIKEVHN